MSDLVTPSRPAVPAPTMIEFSGVEVRYGRSIALPGFELSIRAGEFFTLLGPSGCGKTTALRTLAGLVDPAAGTITIAGRDVTRLRGDQRELGMVFQNYALFPSMSVRENIAFGLKVARVSRAEIQRRVADVAAKVELTTALLDRTVAELSGGQQQRVAIARSLILEPKILLLDEPLSNLDAKLRQQLRIQLKELQRRVGITTVYVTHDQEEALCLSDRIAVMSAGRIEQLGTPQDIYHRPVSEFVCQFIGDANRLTPAMIDRLALPAGAAYIRTDRVGLRVAEAREENGGIVGEVVDQSFQGHSQTFFVDCGDLGKIRAMVPDTGNLPFRTNDQVAVVIPAEHVLAYGGKAS